MSGRVAAAVVALGLGLGAQAPFAILSTHLPLPERGRPYRVQLEAAGGVAPYHWSVAEGRLPAGLRLEADGEIVGRAESSAGFSVLVRVEDSGQPPLVETRLLPAAKAAPIELRWTAEPEVHAAGGAGSGGQLAGAVEVANHAAEAAEMTLLVVAVNQDGKAFALYYFHQPLRQEEGSGPLGFDVFVPPGAYRVHVDAVAEVRPGVIYRSRLMQGGLEVP